MDSLFASSGNGFVARPGKGGSELMAMVDRSKMGDIRRNVIVKQAIMNWCGLEKSFTPPPAALEGLCGSLARFKISLPF